MLVESVLANAPGRELRSRSLAQASWRCFFGIIVFLSISFPLSLSCSYYCISCFALSYFILHFCCCTVKLTHDLSQRSALLNPCQFAAWLNSDSPITHDAGSDCHNSDLLHAPNPTPNDPARLKPFAWQFNSLARPAPFHPLHAGKLSSSHTHGRFGAAIQST